MKATPTLSPNLVLEPKTPGFHLIQQFELCFSISQRIDHIGESLWQRFSHHIRKLEPKKEPKAKCSLHSPAPPGLIPLSRAYLPLYHHQLGMRTGMEWMF